MKTEQTIKRLIHCYCWWWWNTLIRLWRDRHVDPKPEWENKKHKPRIKHSLRRHLVNEGGDDGKIWRSTLKSSAKLTWAVPGTEANNEIRVTGDDFFNMTRLLRLVRFVISYVLPKMWIIYKNTSRANKDAHSFILVTAMTQGPPDFKTGSICSNTKRSAANCSYQQGHFLTEPHIRKPMAWLFDNAYLSR